jgi:hypothetical protein
MPVKKKQGTVGGNGASPVVKSGKTSPVTVTTETVQRLERAGSSESAKIAREYVKEA